MQPLINGTAYSWSQIQLLILGQIVAGVTKITYEDKQEIQDNFGAGNRPVSRGYGKIETKASVTLEMAEVEALTDASPTGSLNGIPEFTIIVSFVPLGGAVRTHTLHNCRFMTNKRDMKTGDMNVEVELELACSHITWK